MEQSQSINDRPPDRAAVIAAQEDPHPILRGTERVLLVDDEVSLLEITAQALKQLGYQPVALQSAREAIELFTRDPNAFDIVVVDQTMLEMKGDELISKMRRIRSDVPTVLWTGWGPVDHAVKGSESDIDAF